MKPLWPLRYYNKYHMVGNFCEGFIFASWEPFAQIKTAKFSLSMCKSSKPHFNLAYFKLSSRPNSNKSWSVSVTLMATAQVIQDIKVLRKDRRMNHGPAIFVYTGGDESRSNCLSVLCMRLLFSPHWNKELRLQSLSVNNLEICSAFSGTVS